MAAQSGSSWNSPNYPQRVIWRTAAGAPLGFQIGSNCRFGGRAAAHRYMVFAKYDAASDLESDWRARECVHIADNWSELPATVAGNGVRAVLEFLGHALSCVPGVSRPRTARVSLFGVLTPWRGRWRNPWAWWEGRFLGFSYRRAR